MAEASISRAGPWKLLERIGMGGMGEVWRAVGPQGVAAVKLLRHGLRGSDQLRRFER